MSIWTNKTALKKSCISEFDGESNEKLVERYQTIVESRKKLQESELEIFKIIVSRGINSDSCNGYAVAIKARDTVRVDHEQVTAIMSSDLSPVQNFGVDPFRTKFEIDKREMDRLKDREPEYYRSVIAPVLTFEPGKPSIAIKKDGGSK